MQEYPVNAEVPQGFILEPTLFLLYVNDLDGIICNITIYADDATLYSKCEKASDLWQQLRLASELEFDQLDTIDLARKWLVDFQCCKTELVCLRSLIILILWEKRSILEDKLSSMMLGNWRLDSFYEVSFTLSCSLSQ